MIQLRTFALQLLLGLCGGAAQAQFQVVHDVPNTSSNPQITPLILADGNTVTYQWNDGQHIFRKYDTNGGLVWSRGMEGSYFSEWNSEPSMVLMKRGTDGFRFARIVEVTYTPTEDLVEDLVEISIHVVDVDANGEPISGSLVKKSYLTSSPVSFFPGGIDAALGPNGDVVLALTTIEGPSGSIELVKLSDAGVVQWGRSVGQTFGLPGVPTLTFGTHPQARVALSGTGRVYFTDGDRYGQTNLRLAELGPNGDLLWMKLYTYANIGPSAEFHDIVVDGSGSVHAGGTISTSVGRFHYFLRTDADGTLDRGDLYRAPHAVLGGAFSLDDQGRRYHFVSTLGPTQGVLVADTLDNPAFYLRRADEVILPNNVFDVQHTMDVEGDRVALSGLLHHEHVDLAFTTRYETLASMETGALSACLFSDTALAHIEIPLEIMTTEDIPNAVSIDVSSYYTSEPITLSFTALDPEPLEGLCAFASEILGVNLGLEESSTSEQAPLVLNSLVAQGTPVVLNDAKVNAVAVYDVHGALVQRTTIRAGRAIATTGWPSGVYILHAMDARGMPLRVGRVVVE